MTWLDDNKRMFEQSSLYRYYNEVLTCDAPSSLMLERFDNWLYNVRKYDTAAHPDTLLSHLFDLYRAEYAAYVYEQGWEEFARMLVDAKLVAPRMGS